MLIPEESGREPATPGRETSPVAAGTDGDGLDLALCRQAPEPSPPTQAPLKLYPALPRPAWSCPIASLMALCTWGCGEANHAVTSRPLTATRTVRSPSSAGCRRITISRDPLDASRTSASATWPRTVEVATSEVRAGVGAGCADAGAGSAPAGDAPAVPSPAAGATEMGVKRPRSSPRSPAPRPESSAVSATISESLPDGAASETDGVGVACERAGPEAAPGVMLRDGPAASAAAGNDGSAVAGPAVKSSAGRATDGVVSAADLAIAA